MAALYFVFGPNEGPDVKPQMLASFCSKFGHMPTATGANHGEWLVAALARHEETRGEHPQLENLPDYELGASKQL